MRPKTNEELKGHSHSISFINPAVLLIWVPLPFNKVADSSLRRNECKTRFFCERTVAEAHRTCGTSLRVQNLLDLVNLAVSVTICGTRVVTLSRLLRGISTGISRSRRRFRPLSIRVAFVSHGRCGDLRDGTGFKYRKRKAEPEPHESTPRLTGPDPQRSETVCSNSA